MRRPFCLLAGLTWSAMVGCGGSESAADSPSTSSAVGVGGGGFGGGSVGAGSGGGSSGGAGVVGGAGSRDAGADRDPSSATDAAHGPDASADATPAPEPGCPAGSASGLCAPGTTCHYGDLTCLCWLDGTPGQAPGWRCTRPGMEAGPPPTPPKCPEMAPKSFTGCGPQNQRCDYTDVTCTCVGMDVNYWSCSPKRD